METSVVFTPSDEYRLDFDRQGQVESPQGWRPLTIEIQAIAWKGMNTPEVSMPQPLIVTEKATEAAGHRDPARDGGEGTPETPGHGSDGFLVAWASSPRMDHQRSERRPHGGQDAHRTMGSIATGGPYGPASAAGSGSATARSARARCGHGSRTRPSDTGSATDERRRPLSRSASPPLQLAPLRRPATTSSPDDSQSPPVVSTAFLVPGARFFVTRSPRVPPLRMCPCRIETKAAHSQGPHARRCALFRAPQGSRITRTGVGRRRGNEGRVPGIRRSLSGRRQADSLSAVPGSRTRDSEYPLETPEGGRDHPSRTNASCHRRAASRSGGATSAERDGRPVQQRIK
jgi:hypothetical protein